MALVDSGTSKYYLPPKAITSIGLYTSPTLVHLKLADGLRIRSTQQVQGVKCTFGNFVCIVNFTVTKLLHQGDRHGVRSRLVGRVEPYHCKVEIDGKYLDKEVLGTTLGIVVG